ALKFQAGHGDCAAGPTRARSASAALACRLSCAPGHGLGGSVRPSFLRRDACKGATNRVLLPAVAFMIAAIVVPLALSHSPPKTCVNRTQTCTLRGKSRVRRSLSS